MSLQKAYPFRRVSVDHMIHGVSRIWWQLEPAFNDAGPYTFRVQVGGTGLEEADDWRNIDPVIVNGFYGTDNKRHAFGTVLTPHYRVVLTTATGEYTSAPASTAGELGEEDWLKAREIIRKETVRNKKVAVSGYLLKAFRYGAPCPRCRDVLTQETADNDCPVCNGTGFQGGFHPPLPLQCWELSPPSISEDIDINLKGSTRENAYVTARVIGFPALNYLDIWVNSTNDERWSVLEIQVAAAIRGVPIVYQVKMGLLPFNNSAYHIPIVTADAPVAPRLPIPGTGCIEVRTAYNNEDLSYRTANNLPVADAKVYVFTHADYRAAYPANPPRTRAIAGTTTTSTGAFLSTLYLDPGMYALLYEKHGDYGPDVKQLTVLDPRIPVFASSSSSTSSIAGSSSSSACAVPVVPVRRVNTFWDI